MLQLRGYQLDAVDFLADEGGYLGDDPGLGKTATILSVVRSYTAAIKRPTILVVGGSNSLGVWKQEIDKWLPDYFQVRFYRGPNRIRAFQDVLQFGGFLLVNYASVKALVQDTGYRHWHCLIVDEAHTYRTKGAVKYRFLQMLSANRVYALSGSPVVSRLADLWLMLHIIDRKTFPNYWYFVDHYFVTRSNGFGKEILGIKSEKRESLSSLLREYVIRRTEKQVAKQLPPMIRQTVPLQLTDYQRSIYDQMASTWEYQTPRGIQIIPNVLALDMRLRQLLVSPALLGLNDDSAMMSALREYLDLDFTAGRSSVVFTPFNAAIPLVERIATSIGIKAYRLIGGKSPQDFAQTLSDFSDSADLGPSVLIAQIAVAQSWSATCAQSAYFLGFDWDATRLTQAEKRLHREGQQGTVFVRYFMHPNTIDDRILEVIDGKFTQAQMLQRLVAPISVSV